MVNEHDKKMLHVKLYNQNVFLLLNVSHIYLAQSKTDYSLCNVTSKQYVCYMRTYEQKQGNFWLYQNFGQEL